MPGSLCSSRPAAGRHPPRFRLSQPLCSLSEILSCCRADLLHLHMQSAAAHMSSWAAGLTWQGQISLGPKMFTSVCHWTSKLACLYRQAPARAHPLSLATGEAPARRGGRAGEARCGHLEPVHDHPARHLRPEERRLLPEQGRPRQVPVCGLLQHRTPPDVARGGQDQAGHQRRASSPVREPHPVSGRHAPDLGELPPLQPARDARPQDGRSPVRGLGEEVGQHRH